MKRCERWLLLAACVTVGWFFVWTVRSTGEPWKFGKEKRDYYNLLIDGYLNGQLHMKVEVPEALLNLRNPYDPQERPAGLGLHDASYYKGKYYVYFGAAPMLVLMLPFRVVTGMDLPLPVAILIFVYAGFLASVVLWLAVRRRYFAETHTVTTVLGVLVLGLGGLCPVLLRRPDMWELPIAGGYCFAMLALGSIWLSLHSERFAARWFACAGLFVGLAIASRPTYLVAAPLLVPPLLWWWWWRARRLPWRNALSAVVPLAMIGALMAWHNYARFDDPLQFGQAYQFSLDYESKLPHFAASYVPFTVKAHFFSAAQWSPYFPFIQRPDLGTAPAGFTIHRGDVYGLLINFPFAWLAFLVPLAVWRRPTNERGLLGAWLGSVALLFVLATGLLLFFFSALARYQMDFAPALILLACVGLLGLERWLQGITRTPWRSLARVGWISAAVFSVSFGVVFSLGFDGLLHEHNESLEQRVARTLNRIPAAFETVLGLRRGSLELTLRVPKEIRAGRETLLTIGEPGRLDRVFVQYIGNGEVQIGVVLANMPELLSRPLTLAPDSAHRLHVTLGALFPPATHPMFSNHSVDDVRRATELVCVRVNDEPVILDRQRIRTLNSGKVAVGTAALVDPAYPRFRGQVVAVRRMEEVPSFPRGPGPFVRLRLTLPPATPSTSDPLVSFGDADSGVLLGVTRVGTDRIRFVVHGSGANQATSDAIAIGSGVLHEVAMRMDGDVVSARPTIYLWLDGQLVWVRQIKTSAPLSRAMVIGKNSVDAPEFTSQFRGEIFGVQQDAAGHDPLQGGGDTLRARLLFPKRPGTREPLVVTGSTGRADFLVVEYVDDQTIRFGLDHWGAPMRMSKPCRIDYAQVQELEIVMTSVDTVENATVNPETVSGRVRLTLNRSVVWEEAADFFTAERGEVSFGRNTVGGTNCERTFTGDAFDVMRVVRE